MTDPLFPCARCGRKSLLAAIDHGLCLACSCGWRDDEMPAHPALPEHVVAAIRLALEGAATPETAVEIIDRLCDMAGTLDPQATQPTRLLIDAIRELNGTFAVNQV